jgi:hypothetical protein
MKGNDKVNRGGERNYGTGCFRCHLACAQRQQFQVASFLTWIMDNDPVCRFSGAKH